MKTSAYIASLACVVPPFSADQKVAADLIKRTFGPSLTSRSLGLIRATFSHPSIRKRHFAVEAPLSILTENMDERIERFTRKSVELAAEAVRQALAKAALTVDDVAGLVVNTCTGYICPGISTYLIERLGLRNSTRVYDLVGSGCGGAIPNLQLAESLLKSQGGIWISVSVEICSAAFQMGNDLSLIMSNALFGDGAAAVVLWDKPAGLELVASVGRYVPEQRDAIRFIHKDGQLHNQLSMDLPDLVAPAAAGVATDLLSLAGLEMHDVSHWALHTGGEKIINAVRDGIGLPEEKLWATRKILGEYGNMSSPTIWFVLEELQERDMLSGEWCCLLAYGAGLSAHGVVVRKC